MTAPEAKKQETPVVPIDERRLLLAHRAGEPGAFRELVQHYRAPVYSYLSRCGISSTDRDDLFQEIFLRVHRGAASFQAERALHPWLFTIVANVVRTHLRRQRVRQLIYAEPCEAGSDDPPAPAANGEQTAVARQTITWLEEQLKQLPRRRREVLLLACVEGLPLKQVAAMLGLPLGTVKTHLRRARLALADRLLQLQRAEVSS